MHGTLEQTTTSDGIRLHGFLTASNQSGCAWIFVHGVNSNFYSSGLLLDLAGRISSKNDSVLLANTRGHDILSFNSGPAPMRTGSQVENLFCSQLDLDAWFQFLSKRGFERIMLLGHSLGAIKSILWSVKGNRFLRGLVAVSPPRLNTNLLLNDAKRGGVFQEHLTDAKQRCDAGDADYVMKVRFPVPMWISAGAYLDKYGSGEKYDYLQLIEDLDIPSLWTFGQYEVEEGSANFKGADLALRKRVSSKESGCEKHSVCVVPNADHSYRGVTAQLADCITAWDRERRLVG